ncbi:hypothetical protein B0H65DRAFT_499466 [Neurospora tetraspora]|uniref:Uncharacterized protein n=1 Tax=Neurospora tetraspora TaxID=94610 RepID=A0AAE0J876_9PEZI|nr:hypothetical protein B0H65DRAFT_499466 [Neurospora tetraspora]
MFSIVMEDIRVVAPELEDVNNLSAAYHRAKEEVLAAYYEHFYLGLGVAEVVVEGAVEWATARLLWMKYCGGLDFGMPCPADAFREECEEHMTRPDEAWLVYVAGKMEEDGVN